MNKVQELWTENKKFRYSAIAIGIAGVTWLISTQLFSTPSKTVHVKRKDAVQTNILDNKQVDSLDKKDSEAMYAQIREENRKRQVEDERVRKENEQRDKNIKDVMQDQKLELAQLKRKIDELTNGSGSSKQNSLDRHQRPGSTQVQTNPYQLNPTAPVNGLSPTIANEIVQPTRKQPVRTITQTAVTTTGENGQVQVTNVSARSIADKNVKGNSAKSKGDGTTPVDSKARHAGNKKDQYLPATTIITGVLISGLEAPTSLSSKQEPMPVTMRIKKDAILPNNFTMDLKDCNMQGAAVGDLASIRAYIRATSLSCVNSKGQAFDIKIEAYAVSEFDGKNGLKGNLISRNGDALMGAGWSGGLSAVSKSLSPRSVTSINIDPGSQQSFQAPNLGAMGALAGAGAAGGALEKLADYYTAIADQQWPVVEIPPGTSVTFIVQAGASIPTELSVR